MLNVDHLILNGDLQANPFCMDLVLDVVLFSLLLVLIPV